MTDQPQSFEAEEFWRDKPIKKWVVDLERKKRLRKSATIEEKRRHSHRMYVAARDKSGAIITAKNNTFLQKPVICVGIRLATPDDLGCSWR